VRHYCPQISPDSRDGFSVVAVIAFLKGKIMSALLFTPMLAADTAVAPLGALVIVILAVCAIIRSKMPA